MTAKRRSSGSMTCPARPRCNDSHSEGTTAFRSGRRMASASRFSPIATATSPSSGSPSTAATPNASRSPIWANSHAPESWSPKADRLLFSVTKGSDVSLWTFSLQDRKATPFGEVHSTNPTGAVFSPDGQWVAYTSTERGKTTIYVQPFPPPGAKYQLFAKGSDAPHEWSGHQTERNCFTIRARRDSRLSASRRNRRLPSGILWRCRDRSKA